MPVSPLSVCFTHLRPLLCLLCVVAGFLISPPKTSAAFFGESISAGDPLNIQADETHYNQTAGYTRFIGHVKVTQPQRGLRIEGPSANIAMGPDGNAKIAYFSDRPIVKRQLPNKPLDELIADDIEIDLQQSLFKAVGHVQSDIRSVAAAPIRILSDVQQFDNTRRLLSANGGVQVYYDDIHITSSRAIMTLDANNDAEQVVFLGNARLRQGNSVINSDRLTIKAKSKNVLAEGNVRSRVVVSNAKGNSTVVMNSAYQQFDKTANTILASGGVHIEYEEYVVDGPKANIRLKPGGSMDVDNMLLTGRSTITDKERKVTADRILITTNPRKFDARGNVKTQFQAKAKPKATASAGKSAAGSASKTLKPGATNTKPAATKPVLTEEEELGLD